MATTRANTPVVYDINVLVNALVGAESTFPLLEAIPPTSANPSADCLSIAFDANEFRLNVSPHILTNTARVLKQLGLSAGLIEEYVETVLDIVAVSGGGVIDPPRRVLDVSDYEDNLILDLVVATDSRILVTDDADLTALSPWNGRLILRPRTFVNRVTQARRTR